jgi:hypothetical protein
MRCTTTKLTLVPVQAPTAGTLTNYVDWSATLMAAVMV